MSEADAPPSWPWTAVAISPQYAEASDAEKRLIRERYFTDLIAPRVQDADRERARRLFEAEVRDATGPAGGLPRSGREDVADAAAWWAENLTQATPMTRFAKSLRDMLAARGIGEPSLEEQHAHAAAREAHRRAAFQNGLNPRVLTEMPPTLAGAPIQPARSIQTPSADSFPGEPEPESRLDTDVRAAFPQEEAREASELVARRVRAAHGQRAVAGMYYEKRLREWLDEVRNAVALQAAGGRAVKMERF